MSTKVEKTVVVDVPLSTVYNQWTQFEEFPHFMNGVKSVTQLSDDRLEWVAELGGVRRQWEARIVEQVPDSRVSWAATEGATNAGTVMFHEAGEGRTEVHLVLEYEPEGLVEKAGDKLNVVENQAEGDLERFKKFIEDEDYATGAWRGSVNENAPVGTPGVEDAAASRGDQGKAGLSGKAVAAGVAAAGVAAAGAAAAAKKKEDSGPSSSTGTSSDADRSTGAVHGTSQVMAMLTTHPGDLGAVAKEKLAACIAACFECAQACTACADACLSEDMVAELTTCIRTNLDCADICATTGSVLSRHTGYDAELTRSVLEACRTACRACGDECAEHAGMHEHCRVCAEACRRCEAACADLITSLG